MSSATIKELVESLHTALETIQGPSESSHYSYKINNGADFNQIIRRCVLNLPSELCKFLKLTPNSNEQAHKTKRFPKVKGLIKCYFEDLIKILGNVTSESILKILLKHLYEMLRFAPSFSSLLQPLLKILLKFWSSAEVTVRLVAFKCILRLACQNNKVQLEKILKLMYLKFVINAKFVSPNTLPGINFMRHSLVEIYLLDSNVAYTSAFLYIRQLAIQLRNAIRVKKKENYQAVYNWQFINSLKFWSELLPKTEEKSMLNELIYPLIQIINGTITLIPTVQYYPLRFHCVQMLIDISKVSNFFIPSNSYVLEILNSYNFNKKHKVVSMKPISLFCLLRMSKCQLQENGFKNSIIENVFRLILENAAKDSSHIYFPELYIPCIKQLRGFLKKNNVTVFGKQMKQLLSKIEETIKFIEKEREGIDLKDNLGIKNWENRIRTDGTPISKFYETWNKVYTEKLKIMVAKSDTENTDTINPKKALKRTKQAAAHSDDSDVEVPVKKGQKTQEKQKKSKKKKLANKKPADVHIINEKTDDADIVRNIKLDDWD